MSFLPCSPVAMKWLRWTRERGTDEARAVIEVACAGGGSEIWNAAPAWLLENRALIADAPTDAQIRAYMGQIDAISPEQLQDEQAANRAQERVSAADNALAERQAEEIENRGLGAILADEVGGRITNALGLDPAGAREVGGKILIGVVMLTVGVAVKKAVLG